MNRTNLLRPARTHLITRRSVRNLFLFMLTSVVILRGAVYSLLKLSQPRLEGNQPLPGLESIVSVLRDEHGVPSVVATTREDAARALGFIHAQERFFQMDCLRRYAAGELAELLGPGSEEDFADPGKDAPLELDRRNRRHRFRHYSEAAWKRLAEEDEGRRLLQAYSDGVNSGLDGLRSRPWEYWLLGSRPVEWHPQDSFLVAFTMHLFLQDNAPALEVLSINALERMPLDIHSYFFRNGSAYESPLPGLGKGKAILEIPEKSQWPPYLDSRGHIPPPDEERSQGSLEPEGTWGSNAWVVGGEHTESGAPMMANDMHLGLSVPNLWFRAAISYRTDNEEDVNVQGLTLPGMPFIVAGSNGSVVWGFANSFLTAHQWVRIPLSPSAEEEKEMELETHIEWLNIRDQDPERIEFQWTRWGLVSDEHPSLVSRWIAYHPDSLNLNIRKLETAATVEEAIGIAHSAGCIPAQNFLVGDSQGNIGWTIIGKLPMWSGIPGGTAVPSKEAESGEWALPAEDYPHIKARSGIFVSANNSMSGEGMLAIGPFANPVRANRIQELLEGLTDATPADHLAIQLDTTSPFLRRWQELLLEVIDSRSPAEHPDLADFRDLIASWSGEAAPDSAAYRWIRIFRDDVYEHVLGRLLFLPGELDTLKKLGTQRSFFEEAVWKIVHEKPAYLADPKFSGWPEELFFRLESLLSTSEGSPADQTWGKYNRTEIRHPFSRALPLFSYWLDVPDRPLTGDSDVIRAAGPGFGASNRTVVSPGSEYEGILITPGGQTGHPLSPYFRAGHQDWAEGRPSAFQPGTPRYKLTLVP